MAEGSPNYPSPGQSPRPARGCRPELATCRRPRRRCRPVRFGAATSSRYRAGASAVFCTLETTRHTSKSPRSSRSAPCSRWRHPNPRSSATSARLRTTNPGPKADASEKKIVDIELLGEAVTSQDDGGKTFFQPGVSIYPVLGEPIVTKGSRAACCLKARSARSGR